MLGVETVEDNGLAAIEVRRAQPSAELLIFDCEPAAGFCQEVDHRDGAYLNALVRAFKQALHASGKLPGNVQNGFLARFDRVRCIGRQLANGVGGTWKFCFPSSIYQSTPGLIQGSRKFNAACRPKDPATL